MYSTILMTTETQPCSCWQVDAKNRRCNHRCSLEISNLYAIFLRHGAEWGVDLSILGLALIRTNLFGMHISCLCIYLYEVQKAVPRVRLSHNMYTAVRKERWHMFVRSQVQLSG